MEEDKGKHAMEDTGKSPVFDDLKAQDKGPVFPELEPPAGWDNKLSTTDTGYSEEEKEEIRMQAAQDYQEYLAKKEMDKDGKQSAEWIAMMRMEDRKVLAKAFCAEYKYNNDNRQETKTCVSPSASHPWNEKYLSGLSWVGVHGENSICVVTLADNLDMTRVSGTAGNTYKHDIMCDFRRTSIHKIEVLPTLSSNDWMKIVKPFGVVCVNRDINDEGYDEQNAIQFLQREFSKGGSTSTTFSTFKTVQTAISALQRLCKRTFNKANEIEVSLMDPEYKILDNELKYKNWTIEELKISQISKYLIAINDPAFRGESKEVTIKDVELFILQKGLLRPKPPSRKFNFE